MKIDRNLNDNIACVRNLLSRGKQKRQVKNTRPRRHEFFTEPTIYSLPLSFLKVSFDRFSYAMKLILFVLYAFSVCLKIVPTVDKNTTRKMTRFQEDEHCVHHALTITRDLRDQFTPVYFLISVDCGFSHLPDGRNLFITK